ncbi:MAG: hypothetical protein M1827_002496 [Pycnora praestabilis]|nr:MAG: hypothetical protein M1827_002496 [Pycnora praestabilis]
MNKSMEQALTGLIPKHDGLLSPKLIELATSLLAQSRSKASNLKAEEEIARSYACANIACERLKQTLNLPKIEPRPPCPPRVYQKLYKHLDNALAAQPTTPRKRTGPYVSKSTPTPSPAKPRATPRQTPRRSAILRKKGLQRGTIIAGLPEWVMPTIRHLCAASSAPAAAPHVFAGVSSILTLPRPLLANDHTSPEEGKKDKILALIIAVYFFVTTRLSGQETSSNDYVTKKKAALEAVAELGEGRNDWEEVTPIDVDAWMAEIGKNRWVTLDWFENITQGAGLDTPRSEAESIDTDGDVEVEDARIPSRVQLSATSASKKNTLQSGLGTMVKSSLAHGSPAYADNGSDAR